MPVHISHRHRRAVLQQRIELRELDDRIGHLRIAARGFEAHFGTVDEPVAAFPHSPAEVRALGNRRHFLVDTLADVGHVHRPRLRVPREALRIARAVRVDLAERVRIVVVHERVVLRNAVLAVRAVLAQRIDAENLAERRSQILRHVHRIAAGAAIGVAGIQQTVVGAAAPRGRVEAELAAVVIHERPMPPHQLARGVTVVGCGGRILRRPLEEHRMVRHFRARRCGRPIRGRRDVAGVDVGVDLSVAARAAPIEVGMEREALEAALEVLELHGHVPARILMIEVRRHRFSVHAHRVERAVHVVDEHAPRAGLVAHQHRTRGIHAHVWQRGELDEVHLDGACNRREWDPETDRACRSARAAADLAARVPARRALQARPAAAHPAAGESAEASARNAEDTVTTTTANA